ncbi:uncharacterized protein BDR25DRAFT_30050 [Lindgomyces ingoldianus]|uniref:Uncharacterized protein n=1 Tax=Lindgomyces ingoldianus TaxID=673940 RepID=A0ACB6QYA8_9PLEO|nr:uncharacterized protein BDR25DRAFT_30050 [Lindgomyces ingoldianus]KAF2471065.1 hypothetical protein BDR25DRAFT_30050 [Lindgomyces ingoldianus]
MGSFQTWTAYHTTLILHIANRKGKQQEPSDQKCPRWKWTERQCHQTPCHTRPYYK